MIRSIDKLHMYTSFFILKIFIIWYKFTQQNSYFNFDGKIFYSVAMLDDDAINYRLINHKCLKFVHICLIIDYWLPWKLICFLLTSQFTHKYEYKYFNRQKPSTPDIFSTYLKI